MAAVPLAAELAAAGWRPGTPLALAPVLGQGVLRLVFRAIFFGGSLAHPEQEGPRADPSRAKRSAVQT